MSNFVEVSRVKQLFTQFRGTDAELTDIRNACCTSVERYLGRTILETQFLETYSGSPSVPQLLMLNNFPVTRINRLSRSPSAVIYICNTTADRATVSVYATGLILTAYTGGDVDTDTILFEDAPTVGDVADAINALTGWTAT